MLTLEQHEDSLGMFTDKTMYQVNGAVLLDMAKKGYPSIKAFSRDTGMTRTRIYKETFSVPPELRQRLLDLLRIYNNALKLFENKEKSLEWLLAPNPRFYNSSPFVMAMTNKGARVYDIQEELIGSVTETA